MGFAGLESLPVQIRADELVRAAMTESGATGPTALARELALDMNGQEKVSRWLKGKNAPRFEETIALLELAGWLDLAAISAHREEAPTSAEAAVRAQEEKVRREAQLTRHPRRSRRSA